MDSDDNDPGDLPIPEIAVKGKNDLENVDEAETRALIEKLSPMKNTTKPSETKPISKLAEDKDAKSSGSSQDPISLEDSPVKAKKKPHTKQTTITFGKDDSDSSVGNVMSQSSDDAEVGGFILF